MMSDVYDVRACVRARVCVIHWHCSAQLSMFNMEKRYRNKIIIIIIIIIIIYVCAVCCLHLSLSLSVSVCFLCFFSLCVSSLSTKICNGDVPYNENMTNYCVM